MALRILGMAMRKQLAQQQLVKSAVQATGGSTAFIHNLEKIGKREIVGHGWNGSACYADRVDYPMPSIRFREVNKEIEVLRQKEKQDWRKMSVQEKKALYRASFCQTFAEMKAPTGEWKMHIGVAMIFSSLAIWIALLMNMFVYDEMPVTFDEDRQKAQLKRMLDLEMNPVTGLSSKWDYENKKWK